MTKDKGLNTPSTQISDAKLVGVFLGAALGDALGWPYENRARNSSSKTAGTLRFSDWTKRSGGRFQPHEEFIPAGSYSDDTQLLIAVSRARAISPEWWTYFATVELPLWLTYERGGGGATLRAARSWLKGIPPWESGPSERERYFQAGGNGAAMRIAPHILSNLGRPFEKVAEDIVLDSVVTHGHPSAIVGALAYGFALWTAIHNSQTLEYGHLLRAVRENVSFWGVWRAIDAIWPNWLSTANNYGFEGAWAETVASFTSQIDVAAESLEAGALSLDQSTLEALGCFDKSISGAGTVAASAAIYLASRYAAGPMEGLTAAAFARGADTDTIASMTGALLGAVNGVEWLGSLVREVQDYEFIADMARSLRHAAPDELPFKRVDHRYIDRILADLDKGRPIHMPPGFPSVAREVDMVRANSQNLQARSWILQEPHFQTIVIKKLIRAKRETASQRDQETFAFKSEEPDTLPWEATFAGIGLYATDISQSVNFYHRLLGLPIVRQTSKMIQLGEHLVLRPSPNKERGGSGTLVYIQVNDLESCLNILRNAGVMPSEIERGGSRRSLTCVDPDGRTVEVFQRF